MHPSTHPCIHPSIHPVKLYENLRLVEQRRDQLMIEMQSTLSPQEEKEMLLKQVKDDNAEIAIMERQWVISDVII